MKFRTFKKVLVLAIIFCCTQIIISCDNKKSISFSNESLENIEALELSGVKSFNYKSDELKANTSEIAANLASYTNTDTFADDSDTFNVINSNAGSFVFSKSMQTYENENNTPNLPDENDAINIAEEHLANLKLAPATYETDSVDKKVVTHVGGLCMASLDKYGVTTEYNKLVTVHYERKLAGLSVMGSSRIVMQLGADGELAGLVLSWPKINNDNVLAAAKTIEKSKMKDYIIKTLKSIYKNIDEVGADSILIKSIKLVMYDDDNKQVIEPALFILGEIISADGTAKHADWLIPVLTKYKASYSTLEKPEVMPDVNPE